MLKTFENTGNEKHAIRLTLSSTDPSTEKKTTELSDQPKVRVALEHSTVQDQLPAWSKALGFSDQFVKAQRESTLQRWARRGPGFSIPAETEFAAGTVGVFATVIGAIVLTVGKLAPDAPAQAAAVGAYTLMGSAAVGFGGFADHAIRLFCKAVAPLQRKNWLWGAKVTPEISEKELAPVLAQFDRASPEERAFLGMFLERWYEHLIQDADSRGGRRSRKEKGKLQGPAGHALRKRIKAFRSLPQEIRDKTERPFALYDAIFDLSGKGKLSIRDADLPQIRSAFEALEFEERQAIAPMLSGMLFESNKAKYPMEGKVLAYLSQALAESDGGRAAQIEVHHLIFGEGNKPRRLGPSEMNKMRELLNTMSPEEAQGCRTKIRETYFNQGRSTVELDSVTTIDLWEMVSED